MVRGREPTRSIFDGIIVMSYRSLTARVEGVTLHGCSEGSICLICCHDRNSCYGFSFLFFFIPVNCHHLAAKLRSARGHPG